MKVFEFVQVVFIFSFSFQVVVSDLYTSICSYIFIYFDTFSYLYDAGEIDNVLIVAPKGNYLNWVNNEIPTHLPDYINKKVVLFSLPGAFTPTCSSNHLPRYEELYDEFRSQGVDQVICLSVNDAFVMFQWGKHIGVKNIFLLPDGNGEFTSQAGMLCSKRDKCFGDRSWRYAAIINDGVVEKLFVEPGKTDDTPEDPYGESSPENVMKYFQSLNQSNSI